MDTILNHGNFLLARPANAMFCASISMAVDILLIRNWSLKFTGLREDRLFCALLVNEKIY